MNVLAGTLTLVIVCSLCGCSLFRTEQKPLAAPCALPKTEKARIEKAFSTVPNTTTPALFILPGEVRPVTDLPAILDKMRQEHPARTIVIYIHGRGAEPSKSINDGLLAGLSIEYRLNPVMLTWASGEAMFPEDQALAAGAALGQVLSELSAYKKQRAESLQGVKFTLITHSMGSLVLEGFARGYQKSGLPPDLLDAVVVNAAASTVDNHAEWMEKIDFTPKVYVTYGHDDPILKLAGIGLDTARLGKHGARQYGEKERLAGNTVYVDFSQAVQEHRYFVGNGNQACVYNFFNDVLNGKTPDFADTRFFTVAIPGKDYIVNR